jgi:DNA processing protein
MNREALLHLTLIDTVGPATIQRIVARCGFNNLHQVYRYTQHDFMSCGISNALSKTIVDNLADKKNLHLELNNIHKYAVAWTTIHDSDYPEHLKHIHQPPPVLYWRGIPLNHFAKMVAIIGSRKANSYGKMVVGSIVPDLVAAGWCIVSGGALGADSMAHHEALSVGGATVAVIGSGLLRPYPLTNVALYEKIIEKGGTVVSSFGLTMGALPGNFPARNRIISGLCKGVVVIQAALESGTRITALYGLEQGREVCAVPGPINDPLSAGCHKLISEGAALVTSGADVLTLLGDANIKKAVQHKIIEDPLLAACQEAKTFDELLIIIPDNNILNERLCSLQMDGILKQDFIGRWQVL